MLERQLAGKSRALIIVPVLMTLLIAAYALLTAQNVGGHPRDLLFDGFERLHPRSTASANLDDYVIIDIDEESLQKLGPWPWPRTSLAKLVTTATKADAKGVVLATTVDGPDPLSPEIVGRYWLEDARNAPLAEAISALPSHDVALAASLRDSNGVIALGARARADWNHRANLKRTDIDASDWLILPDGNGQSEMVALWPVNTNGLIDRTLQAVAMPSVLALTLDKDGRLRRLPPVWNAYDSPTPSTALAIARINGAKIMIIPHKTRSTAAGKPIAALRINDNILPLDQSGALRLYQPRKSAIATVPAWRLLTTGQNWSAALSGKTVIIGESVSAGAHVKSNAHELSVAEAHILFADQMLAGIAPIRPVWAGMLEAGLVLIFGVLIIFAALILRPSLVTSITIATAFLLLTANWLIFNSTVMLIDFLPAIGTVLMVPIAMVVTHFVNSIIRDDHLRGAFHGALPPATMQHIGRPKGAGLLNGVRRQVTVLSCGVRLPRQAMAQFVDRSDEFIHFIAQSNDKLRRTILDHGGTVDHGEDGRLLGYWNVPEENAHHVEQACACALDMIDDMVTLSQDVEMSVLARGSKAAVAQQETAFEQGYIEIGLASDICYSGPVGRGTRNRYSVIGDAVALASHLRSRSRQYGPAIICDETVFMGMRHHYAFLDLDTLRINDSQQITPIYGLVGNPFLKASRGFRDLADRQRALIIAWRSGEFDVASAHLEQLKDIPGINKFFIEMYEQRIAEAKQNQKLGRRSDDKEWDGSISVML